MQNYNLQFTDSGHEPLAARMRPLTMICWGPPGVGKTTLAGIIARKTQAQFITFSAVTGGIKEIREVMKQADANRVSGERTILFVDEIHRFNKGQQDYLLPFVEDGTITLIGATTENPYFEVNNALLSRSHVFELKSLDREDIMTLIDKAVYDKERGMGTYNAEITREATEFLADMAEGDARTALNAVELGVLTTEPSEDGNIHIDLSVAEECIQRRAFRYDKQGDNHYDTISAFIKSMRGSDPDAALYYLAKMINAGESVTFISRRIMICASEDVGMADPNAICVAAACAQAVERIGLPEARIILAEAAVYVATAPKSNASYMGIESALSEVRNSHTGDVPNHLKDAHYKGAAKLGHGDGYLYAHNYPEHYVKQQYLPDELVGTTFYEPTDIGYEERVKERLDRLRSR